MCLHGYDINCVCIRVLRLKQKSKPKHKDQKLIQKTAEKVELQCKRFVSDRVCYEKLVKIAD